MENENFICIGYSEYIDSYGQLIVTRIYNRCATEPPMPYVIEKLEVVENARPFKTGSKKNGWKKFNRKKHYEYD